MTGATTPPGDTTTAREALAEALAASLVGIGYWSDTAVKVQASLTTRYIQHIDALLAGPLSDPDVVAQLPGAAGLMRELDEANELGAVALAVALALEDARAKLARVEKYAGVLADTGPRVYAGSEIARVLRNAIGATP